MAAFWGYASGADGSAPLAPDGTPQLRPAIAAVPARLVGGQLVASWQYVNGTALWLTRITVSATAGDSSTRAFLYVGAVDPANLVSGTASGAFDENDPNQPIFVPEATPVNVVWTTAAGSALARLEYAVSS